MSTPGTSQRLSARWHFVAVSNRIEAIITSYGQETHSGAGVYEMRRSLGRKSKLSLAVSCVLNPNLHLSIVSPFPSSHRLGRHDGHVEVILVAHCDHCSAIFVVTDLDPNVAA